jgi:hypothetical protein
MCRAEREASETDKVKLGALRIEVRDYRLHKDTADHQASEYSRQKNSLKPGECLIVEDFAGRYIVCNDIEMTQKSFFARVGVPDLILVKYWRDEEGGELKSETYDFFSKTEEKDDFHYVRSCWLYLLNNTEELDAFHTVRIWSDGGPKHFKIRRSIFLFSVLQDAYAKTFIWNFFQSCHGKGPCDGHTGVIKRKMKLEARKGNSIQNDREMFEFAKENVKSQSFFLQIDRNKEYDCGTFKKGIHCFFEFSFSGVGVIKCRSLSGVGEYETQLVSAIDGESIPPNFKQVNMDTTD